MGTIRLHPGIGTLLKVFTKESGFPSPGEETQKMWKQWKDSRLAEHHDAMVQRSSQKPGDSVLSMDRQEGRCFFCSLSFSACHTEKLHIPDMN